jgi:hypothetical protein
VTSDIERDGDPRSDAGKQYLASGMPWPKALNEQSAITYWTAEAKSKRNSNALTEEENGKRNGNEPRPPKNQNSDHAHEKNCEPATRPDDEPRLNVEAASDGLFDRVH